MNSTPELFRVLLQWRLDALTGLALAGAALWWAWEQHRRLRATRRLQVEAEQQLAKARVAAAEATRAKCEFLAVMGQELTTPLNSVLGFARLLSETRLDDTQRSYLAPLTTEAEHLGLLINDILDFTLLERGDLVLDSVAFAPVEVARNTLRRFSPRAEEKQVDLRFEAQVHGPLLLSGDPRRFRQILAHLIDNAIRFTPLGSVTLFLSWTSPNEQEPCGRLRVRVRDTGVGLTPEQQERIFQAYSPFDSTAAPQQSGTEIGLSLAQRLVGLMGGVLSVKSAPGAGTEFSFSIPLPPIYLSESPFDGEKYRRLFPRPPRILVVDDLETNRFLLEVFLRRNGFEPELAANGEEAVRLATTRSYDAILMDLYMPEMDGFQATARIRQSDSPARNTPIIALTASLATGLRFKCLAAGMDEELSKPLDLAQFKRVLTTVVGARRGTRTPAATADVS